MRFAVGMSVRLEPMREQQGRSGRFPAISVLSSRISRQPFLSRLDMDPVRRQHYLKALGIDQWVARTANVASANVGAVAETVHAARSPTPAPTPASPAPESVATAVPLPARVRAEPVQGATKAATATVTVTTVAMAAEERQRPQMPPHQVPADWDGLRAAVRDCRACKLCESRTQTVFGVGPEQSALLVVGEAPGADEDAQGEPFVGRAGKLLDQMLAAIGHSRTDSVFIANVLKCRPPGNRDPEADEVRACRPFLDQQIRLIRPRLILALGRIAAQRLLDTDQPLSKLRGPLHAYGDTRTPVLVSYHPAYLLRSPREKAKSWQDLKQVWRQLHAPPG